MAINPRTVKLRTPRFHFFEPKTMNRPSGPMPIRTIDIQFQKGYAIFCSPDLMSLPRDVPNEIT